MNCSSRTRSVVAGLLGFVAVVWTSHASAAPPYVPPGDRDQRLRQFGEQAISPASAGRMADSFVRVPTRLSGIEPMPQDADPFLRTSGELGHAGPFHPAAHQAPENPNLPRPLQPGAPRRLPEQRVWRPQQMLEGEPASEPASTPWIVPYTGSFNTTVLPGSGDTFGITNLDGRVTLLSPKAPQYTLTPGTIVSFLDGPVRTDLPADLYSMWLEFGYRTKLSDQWALNLAVAPGLYTDFEQSDSDAVRVTGRALAFYSHDETTQFTFGVVYLDRETIAAVPAAGVILTPSDDTRLEFVFPRPRFLRRVVERGNGEGWAYLAGEFGGGSWAIDRTAGFRDVVTYNDFRMLAGFEWLRETKRRLFLEAGWVFGREIEYGSGLGDFDPDDTAMIRVGAGF